MSSIGFERRALDLFQDVLQTEPERRRSLIDERCAEDGALRAEVLDLLGEASKVHGDFLEELLPGARDGGARPDGEAPPPERLGAFRVMEPLGEGGMGKVWVGLQERPVRRRVALKVIRPVHGHRFHGHRARRRFAVECQALAALCHPNVATLYEAGETEQGFPFVAMELVEGCDIAEYCDRRRLGLRARLELFRQVCAAVGHAHDQGVLHRDLKPSNVLVTEVDGRPVAKVIDFGIAHLVDEPTPAAAPADEEALILGSPAYMSPEAAWGSGAADARSDVYSLGLLLYALLAGALPFEVEAQTLLLLRRRAGRNDQPAPSGRFGALPPERQGQIAARRGLQAKALRRRLRGDLDAIVACAISPEPGARYASPSGLAADLEKHLEARPISARPPNWRYVLGRALRRRSATATATATATAVTATALLVLGLGLGAGGGDGVPPKNPGGALEAQSHRADLLVRSGRWAEATDLLNETIPALEGGPGDSSILLAENLLRRGRALEALGRLEPAYDAVDRAFDLFLKDEEQHGREIILSRLLRARIKSGLGLSELAAGEAEETLAVILGLGSPNLDLEAFARRTLATSLLALGRNDEARRHLARAQEVDDLDDGDRPDRAQAQLALEKTARDG
ncbi:MAG: serine/threonine-protein kinase [Acidobacteriota bacterium]